MFWFRKKKQAKIEKADLEQRVHTEMCDKDKIEKKVARDVELATKNLNKAIKNNGFTIRIHAAAGGHQS